MKIRLLKQHEHAGQRCGAGDTLELDAETARWLIERGVAQPLPEPKPKPPKEK